MRHLLLTFAAFFLISPAMAQDTISGGRNFESMELPDLSAFTPEQSAYMQSMTGVGAPTSQYGVTPTGQSVTEQAAAAAAAAQGGQTGFSQMENKPGKQVYRGDSRKTEEAPRTHRMYEPTRY